MAYRLVSDFHHMGFTSYESTFVASYASKKAGTTKLEKGPGLILSQNISNTNNLFHLLVKILLEY